VSSYKAWAIGESSYPTPPFKGRTGGDSLCPCLLSLPAHARLQSLQPELVSWAIPGTAYQNRRLPACLTAFIEQVQLAPMLLQLPLRRQQGLANMIAQAIVETTKAKSGQSTLCSRHNLYCYPPLALSLNTSAWNFPLTVVAIAHLLPC